MYTFKYSSPVLQEKLEDPQKHYPEEVDRELGQFLEVLQTTGEVRGTDFFLGNINKLAAKTFTLHYVSDLSNKTVKILELEINSWEVLKERFSLKDSWNDNDVIDVIPQCDSPPKLIRALRLILNGVTDAYDLGHELGHQGKEREYISRHGNYTRQALDCLKLVISMKKGKKLVPELTERGKKIAEASDALVQEKLLTIAMLEYPPLRKVLTAITEGEDEFDDSTIQNMVFPEEFQEVSTCPRRTQTLKAWIRWISGTSGIPIRLPGGTKQLTLPLFQQ
jgi:hypothetical protein